MYNKFVLLFLLPLFVIGCTSVTISPKKPPINRPSDDASIKLAEAADSVSDSMLEMAKVLKVITPPAQDHALTIPNAYNLQARASVDWSGPIAELVSRIAKAAHFRFHVLGKAPAIPVLISLTAKDESLAKLLRDIDYQAGDRADIHVYPNRQLIELRYAKL